jgi:hypothetical protein
MRHTKHWLLMECNFQYISQLEDGKFAIAREFIQLSMGVRSLHDFTLVLWIQVFALLTMHPPSEMNERVAPPQGSSLWLSQGFLSS